MTKAIILAAGRGSRLYPYTENCPKCLTEIGGRTLLDYQITTLKKCGIKDVVIVSGYLGELLERPDATRLVNPAWAKTNMVESLFCAEEVFEDDFLVCYADIIFEPRVIEALLSAPGDIIVAVNTAWRALWKMRFEDPLADAESLKIDPKGLITAIGDKVESIDDIEGQFMGLMRFRSAGIDALRLARANWNKVARPWMDRRTPANAYMTDLLTEIILMGGALRPAKVAGGWLEIDTAGDFLLSTRLLQDRDATALINPEALLA